MPKQTEPSSGWAEAASAQAVRGDFYESLPPLTDFAQISRHEHFHPVPSEWTIVVADVVNSTEAIEANRYKDVNLIGAACIAAAQNAMGGRDFPYLFGGDGATLIVPPEEIDAVRQALADLRNLALNRFALHVRVGAVPVGEVVDHGLRVEIAKYEVVAGRFVAFARGGGVSWATDRVKDDPERYEVREAPEGLPDLGGLSCRWQPIQSRNGVIVSLLVDVRTKDSAAEYGALMERLREVFGGTFEGVNPIATDSMEYKSVGRNLREEIRYRPISHPLLFLSNLAEIFLAVFLFKGRLAGRLFSLPSRYRKSMTAHADYRKVDDMVQMVADCSPEQVTRLRRELDALYDEGRIYYGLHESPQALMTCYVQGLDDGEHVHFVDGGSGGYALAAKQLKRQMSGGR
jgi:hypothetical protein